MILEIQSVGQIKVSIQRSLLIYLLQDFLFIPKDKKSKTGLDLLQDYYHGMYKKDLGEVCSEFKNGKGRSQLMRKLLPRRLINKRYPKETEVQGGLSGLERILQEANRREEEYKRQLEYKRMTVRSEGSSEVYENFIRKNKGKQFKLRFVRKAWHIMYFREIYKDNLKAAANEHHKSLHITREEYNDFCRYLFAMDTVADYKGYLRELLNKKNFFENSGFKRLFEEGSSLNDYYNKTKTIFEKWIGAQEKNIPDDKYDKPDKYQGIFHKDLSKRILYINLSHFIEFLKEGGRLQIEEGIDDRKRIELPALKNTKYLILDYYCNEWDKDNRKISKRLMTARLEDCLMYEIAFRYLEKEEKLELELEEEKSSSLKVWTIFNSTQKFAIRNNKGGSVLFYIEVPFKQIERYVGIVKHNKEKSKKYSAFLYDLPSYLDAISQREKKNEEMQSIIDRYNTDKVITFDGLLKIQNNLVTESGKFLLLYMELEKYFVYDKRLKQKDHKNYIGYKDIIGLSDLVKGEERNTACHFGIPKTASKTEASNNVPHEDHPKADLYSEKLDKIEKRFILKYVKEYPDYRSIDFAEKGVIDKLLNVHHNDFFRREKGKNKSQRECAEDKYFEKVIKNIRRKKNKEMISHISIEKNNTK